MKILATLIVALLLTACNGIWNGADLEKWVREQAVEAGCVADSIALDDWYVSRDEANIWLGECLDAESGETKSLEIGVDKVWTPSE